MKFVLEEGNLFLLLLDDVSKFEEVGGLLHLLGRVVGVVLILSRLQLQDLLALADACLKLAGLLLELTVFTVLLLNFVAQLLFSFVDGLDPLRTA